MSGINSSKERCLLLLKILLEKTDESYPLSASELEEILLCQYHQNVSRKTIYDDIVALRNVGAVIRQKKGRYGGYYVARRAFSLPELKLLVDAVQATNFITKKKSEELIRKLSCLTSEDQAKALKREVYLMNRPKTKNETIYDLVDTIHKAISGNRQIAFRYTFWTEKKTLEYRKEGQIYQVSPWNLCWDDENYYLLAYDAEADRMKHYRVDKMREIKLLEEIRKGRETYGQFDLAMFARKTFGMYGGSDHLVTLRGRKKLAGAVLDRFGEEVMMVPAGEEEFRVHAMVAVSPQFYGWVTGLGPELVIEGPENVKQEYETYLREILEQYQTGNEE